MRADEPDEAVRLAWKRERREAIRRFHPDRGGSPTELMRAIDRVDKKFGYGLGAYSVGGADPGVTVKHSRGYLLRLKARRLRLLIALARERLPHNWPGSRRYTRF